LSLLAQNKLKYVTCWLMNGGIALIAESKGLTIEFLESGSLPN
jgi:hypothetical protein